MSALDEPNLRSRTMRDGTDFLTRFLFGGQPSRKSVNTWWSVPFGLASLLAPVVLVLFAVARAARALAGGGPVLSLLVVALEAVVVLVGVVLVSRALLRVARSGVPRLRFAVVCAVLVACLGIAGAVISVPATATFGYATDDGRVVLVHAGDDTRAHVPERAHVVLMSSGILANVPVGGGTARAQPPEPTTVPLDAVIPVRADGVPVAAVIVAEVDVSGGGGRVPATGQARVELGTRSLWETLWVSVLSPLSAL